MSKEITDVIEPQLDTGGDRIETYIKKAIAAGLMRDQIELFIAGGYIALPSMLPYHAMARECNRIGGPDAIMLGGTRGPGKSHAELAQAGLDDCQRVAGLKCLFLRKIMKSAGEALEDLTLKVFRHVEHTRRDGQVVFKNGSRILFGGYRVENDIEKYLGLEYDLIILSEATQISEDKRKRIQGSLRSTRSDWRARMYMDTNPDGIGVGWARKEFVIPWREGKEKWTRYFHCNYKDNPFLPPEYVRYLDGLTGSLAKAWRDGDWDAFEGMAFPQWNYSKHVIKSFSIPSNWTKWRAIDWGYASPFCCLWLAREPDTGRVYVYRELYEKLLTDRQQAEKILDYTPINEKILFTYGDPSMWAKKRLDEIVTATADIYIAKGIQYLTPANNDRINGKRKLDMLLSDLPDGKPGLQIFDGCVNTIQQLSDLIHDKDRPEDVDTGLEDHAYDALRYGLTNVRTVVDTQRELQNKRRGSSLYKSRIL